VPTGSAPSGSGGSTAPSNGAASDGSTTSSSSSTSETSANTDFDDATEFTDDVGSGASSADTGSSSGSENADGDDDDEYADDTTEVAAPSTPHVLMILVDDQGHGDIDLGNDKDEFHTPTLSTLAQEGVKLSNFYSACTCTPARAMLMTGRYTIRYGFQDSVLHATEPRGVPLSETFLGEKLQSVGYTTTMIGKW
jgi:hypothetical protein